ncbi:MAG: hypothetical protein ABMA13_20270 [Chthoniobacteraceae bacterium]
MLARLVLAAALTVALSGCEMSGSKTQKPTAAQRRGISAVLAGEWIAPGHGDDYLLFKPDETDPKSGRFSGFGDFTSYEIKSRLFLGRRISIELQSASFDTDLPRTVVTADIAADGRSLRLILPANARGKSSAGRTYRKVTQ